MPKWPVISQMFHPSWRLPTLSTWTSYLDMVLLAMIASYSYLAHHLMRAGWMLILDQCVRLLYYLLVCLLIFSVRFQSLSLGDECLGFYLNHLSYLMFAFLALPRRSKQCKKHNGIQVADHITHMQLWVPKHDWCVLTNKSWVSSQGNWSLPCIGLLA